MITKHFGNFGLYCRSFFVSDEIQFEQTGISENFCFTKPLYAMEVAILSLETEELQNFFQVSWSKT